MREKDENIHSFILNQDRKKNRDAALRECLVSMWLEGSSEIFVSPPRESLARHKRLFKLVQSICRVITRAFDRQVSCLKQSTAAKNTAHAEFSKADALGLFKKDRNLKTVFGMAVVVVPCSLVSIFLLLQLDAIVNQTLYSFGLQFSYEWAAPYWIAIRTILGILLLAIIAAFVFPAYVLWRNCGPKGKNRNWRKCRLPDGRTVKVKTVVKRIKRLENLENDGHPVYSVETDNIVEVA